MRAADGRRSSAPPESRCASSRRSRSPSRRPARRPRAAAAGRTAVADVRTSASRLRRCAVSVSRSIRRRSTRDRSARVSVEPLREDLPHRRSRRLRAEAAVLDHRGDDDRPIRRRARRRRTTTGPVCPSSARCRSCRRPACRSRRRRRQRCRSASVVEASRPSRIAASVGDLDVRAGLRAGSAAARCRRRLSDRQADVRAHDRAAVLERRVSGRQLQRRGEEVALADRERDVVADGPRAVVGDEAVVDAVVFGGTAARAFQRPPAPGGSGTVPAISPPRSIPVGSPKPNAARPSLQLAAVRMPGRVELRAEVVEVGVDRDRDRLRSETAPKTAPPAFLRLWAPSALVHVPVSL